MTEAVPLPTIGPNDRIGLTFTLAVIFHAIVILGTTFAWDPPSEREQAPALDVMLVQTHSLETPEDADYLAQANQEGGGNTVQKARPTQPLSAPVTTPQQGIAPTPPLPSAAPPPTPAQQQLLTTEHAQMVVETAPETKPTEDPQQVSAVDLFNKSLEMASLSTELDKSLQAYAKRPNKKYISARTKEYKYASYMEAWVAKVERIGNLNYPDEARRRNLTGNLRLDVALNPDGSIKNISLEKSSGFKILDDAAVRIVQLSAPFAQFPEDFKDETNELHIIRTWEFIGSNRLKSR